jgi:hypothetical protein
MNDDKERRNIELAADHEVRRLLDLVTKNWEVAKSRMAQITQEREDGINIDNGVEVMAVYIRMERVYEYLYGLTRHSQSYLLPSVVDSLRTFIDDESMDAELVRLIQLTIQNEEVKSTDFWIKLMQNQSELPNKEKFLQSMLPKTIMKYILPNLTPEEMMDVAKAVGNMEELMNDDDDIDGPPDGGLFALGGKIAEVVADNRLQMSLGLLVRHALAEIVCKQIDLQNYDDVDVANIFERAKQRLMARDAWREYWSNHKQHLELKGGSLDEEWKKDAAEVEERLHDMRGYIYNSWNDSPEAFGRALKQQRLDDRDMLLLLFYLAKKDAIARETEEPDERREKMAENAFETAMKLRELAAEKYYNDYEAIWQRIIMSENISELLMDYNSSKYNKGFNMMCLCKIVSHLQSEYKFYGSHSSEDLGKVLGDRYAKNSYDTFSSYIKKKDTMLNDLCFKEIGEVLKNN